MKSKDLLKHRIREGLENYDRSEVSIGLLSKSLGFLRDGYRELETAIQFCDDKVLRDKLNEIKLKLGHDIEVSDDFVTKSPTVISMLSEIIKNHSK